MLRRTVARSGRCVGRSWGVRHRGGRYWGARHWGARRFLRLFAAASAAPPPATLSVPVALDGRTLYGSFGDDDRVRLR
ncbi:MAG: hypothetical protein WB644_01360, partial [Candidatus Cybelea sp.]